MFPSILSLFSNSWGLHITTVFLFLFVFLLSVNLIKQGRKKLPPGPVGLPIFGCLPFVRKRPQVVFHQWAKQYGDIYSLYLGPKLIVVLNSYDTIREALVSHGDIFAARPEGFFTKMITKGHGIIWGNGKPWRVQRKFALKVLRNLGANGDGVEEKILCEVQHMEKAIASKKGKAFDPHNLLNFAIANIISQFVFGIRFNYDDSRFTHILQLLTGWVSKYNFVNNILNFYPSLGSIPGNLFNSTESVDSIRDIINFFQEQIEAHRHAQAPGQTRDFVDAYLEEMTTAKQDKGKDPSFSDFQLEMILRDLFVAAIETTEATLQWGLLFMLMYPDVQSQVQQEIDESFPRNHVITLADKEKLPYTRATIFEIQRKANIDPFSVPRKTTEDTTFRGYFIPKGTDVYPNFWAVNLDERYFENAEKFDPTRYLDQDGKVQRLKPYLPFGMGQRICIGEAMAKRELFLFMANILKSFRLQLPEGTPKPSLEGTFGVVYVPQYFELCATRR